MTTIAKFTTRIERVSMYVSLSLLESGFLYLDLIILAMGIGHSEHREKGAYRKRISLDFQIRSG